MRDIDIKLLRVFRAVVRHGGFAAAQTELGASLPTISLQMKQLEDRLGVRLCERGHGGFRLTAKGEAILKATEHLFASMDSFRNDVAELAKLPIGEVRLGIIDNLVGNPACRIPEAISRLRRAVSGVGLTFFVGPPSELESQVIAGTLDMAVGLFPVRHLALEYATLFAEEHCLYCSRGHPLYDVDERSIDRSSLTRSQYASWSYLEPYVSACTTLKFDAQSGTPFMDGVACLILSGHYIGYLPTYFAQQWVANGQLRALMIGDTTRHIEILLIRRKSQRMKQVIATFYEEMRRCHAATRGRVPATAATRSHRHAIAAAHGRRRARTPATDR